MTGSEAVPDQVPTLAPPRRRFRGVAWVVVGVAVLVGVGLYGWPLADRALTTVTTDDAYVQGYYTLVAPRVPGQVTRVKVEDNNRVKVGDVLLELDPTPNQKIVDVKKAAVSVAEADLTAALAQVEATQALARSQRWKLQAAIDQIDNQIVLVKARVAVLRSREALRTDAKADLDRDKTLLDKGTLSQQVYDKSLADYRVAASQAIQALEDVTAARAFLGLPPKPADSPDLGVVPPDLNQTHPTVRQALADLVQSLTQLGYPIPPIQDTPKQFLAALDKFADGGSTAALLKGLTESAPGVKQARTKLAQARSDLAEAELNLGYCTVTAAIDGVITRRNVNPGNNLTAGQSVMAIRSLDQIWVEANFQETSLDYLAIGQPVDLEVDMYGSKKKFFGRITGFTYGTGQTLALLPPQNATGNFVKVVQRLPVRIDLVGYDPNSENPLFAGLSVVPYVRYKAAPTGPDAGKRLQSLRAGL